VAVVPLNRDVVSFEQALLMADETLYLARQQGHGQVRLHGDTQGVAQLHPRDRINWALVLMDALAHQHLRAHFQCLQPMRPELAEGGLRVEMLMRLWDPVQQQLISPNVFIPPAERYHLIADLDRWMLGETIGFLGRHPELRQLMAMVTVNLSAVSLRDPLLAAQVMAMLETHQVPPSLLCLEITETEAILNFGVAQTFVRSLRDFGCRFALDDFGSGFASFRTLNELDVDSLKIDGSFVREMDKTPARAAMVRSMVDMARHLAKPVVAEWVETDVVARQLIEMGVEWTQGFLFHRPEPLSLDALQAQASASLARAQALQAVDAEVD
jgi:EAL domain-containing protein (putative c-di-GMP-specific phosphodiesterase class I)